MTTMRSLVDQVESAAALLDPTGVLLHANAAWRRVEGATILGGETVIGARSVIGGNVWLTQSVPEDSVVTLEAQQLSIKPRPRSEFRI